MAVLVTGGTGFVGANIVRELAREGEEVVSFDIAPADALMRQFVAPWAGRIEFADGDIRDASAVMALADGYGIDRIIHAATYTVNQRPLEIERGRDVIGINIDGLANILELARTIRAARFVYISSGAVYGAGAAADQTCSEDLPAAPDFLYGITKYAGELLSRRYGELHGFPAVSVRLSTPYGPMERPTGHRAVMSVLYQWTGQAVRGEPLSPDDLDGGRDYIYVVDAARGIRRILNAPNLPHDLYNLTGGVWINNREIVATLTQLAPASATPPAAPSSPTPPVGAPSRGPLSPHRLRQDLGWQPEYDLRAALADYLHWWRESGFDG